VAMARVWMTGAGAGARWVVANLAVIAAVSSCIGVAAFRGFDAGAVGGPVEFVHIR
jgi:hypothetical protein